MIIIGPSYPMDFYICRWLFSSRPWWTLAVASAERRGRGEETHEVSVEKGDVNGIFVGI